MAWWKALLADLGLAALATGMVFIYVRAWLQHRTEMTWPLVEGTVKTLETKRGDKAPWTALVGDYETDHGPHRFVVPWATCDWRDRAWVPPAGTPPVGSKVLLHADPSNPSHVALDSSPRKSTVNDVVILAIVLFSLIATAIAVWFM